MNKNKVFASALTLALLTNAVLPATNIGKENNISLSNVAYAAESSSEAIEAKEKMSKLAKLIDNLDKIGLAPKQLDWVKGLKRGFNIVNKIFTKGIGSVTQLRSNVIPRIDLLIDVAETITADATELADSEQQAHVIIGFSVTRALIKATDIFEDADGLKQASENLKSSLEKAREIPKLTDDSKRTHYTLERLDRAIARAKEIRNKELRDKLDPTKLAEVDMVIRKAEDVRRDNVATVAEVKAAASELNALIDEAFKSIPEGERTANKSNKLGLERSIEAAKNLRDFKLKGKVESAVIAELNREIARANRVFHYAKATLNEVAIAEESITAAIEKAQGSLVSQVDEELATEEVIIEEKTEVVNPDEELPVVEEEIIEEEAPEAIDEIVAEEEIIEEEIPEITEDTTGEIIEVPVVEDVE